MVKAIELARFAEKNGWIVVDKSETEDEDYIRYLTPSGGRVLVEYGPDGKILKVYP